MGTTKYSDAQSFEEMAEKTEDSKIEVEKSDWQIPSEINETTE